MWVWGDEGAAFAGRGEGEGEEREEEEEGGGVEDGGVLEMVFGLMGA